MSTDAVNVPQDARSDKERVLAYVNDCNEGVSLLSVSIGTKIKRSVVESILQDLVTGGRIASAWNGKGYCMYYPKAVPKPVPSPQIVVVPDQEVPTDPEKKAFPKCQFCGRTVEKYLWQHEQFCKSNPNARKPGQKVKEEVPPEPTIDGTVPPLSDPFSEPGAFELSKEGILECSGEECILTAPSSSVQSDVEVTASHSSEPAPTVSSSLSKEVQVTYTGMNYGTPIDPLSRFAQQHRVWVGREISKLKRVERKLRRRAMSLETMAERVAAARQIKERELRKFEKEVAEARP